jgi:broad specificity phosphatase PhoE
MIAVNTQEWIAAMKARQFVCLVALFLAVVSPIILAADTVIIVVRHAEKSADDPKDPNLSDAGMARAKALAVALKDAHLAAVFATEFKRTQQTAAPAALAAGLKVQVRGATPPTAGPYASELLGEITAKYKGQAVLVVGHSNTLPDLINAFSGVTIAPVADNEFDRLYIITLSKRARLVVASYHP